MSINAMRRAQLPRQEKRVIAHAINGWRQARNDLKYFGHFSAKF